MWAAMYVFAHLAGGVVCGMLFGSAGLLLPKRMIEASSPGVAAVCLVAALHEFGLIRLPMPQLHRQVQRHWVRTMHWNAVALGYGVQLGCGVATRIPSIATYVALCFAAVSASPWKGALMMGTFGFVRSWLPVVVGPRLGSPEASMQYAMIFHAHESRIRTIAGGTLLATGIALAAASFWRMT
jgi:hypothetical protein